MTPTTRTLTILTAAIFGSFAATTMAGDGAAAKKTVAPPVEEEDIVVHPITAPYWHEDSFITSDIRPVVARHFFPTEILGGGHASVYAAQLRLKLLPNLQLVANKDGWMEYDTPGYKADGWNDISAGLKWAFLQRDDIKLHAALGAGYEAASGDDQVLQDDDQVRVWASINKGFGKLHLGATVNYFIPLQNGDDILGNSASFSWHLHADYQLCKWFSPVLEFNGYHVTDEDNDVKTPFSGADVLNLGGSREADVVTMAVGGEFRPTRYFSVRAAYEFALTDEVDLFGHRWTFSAVIPF